MRVKINGKREERNAMIYSSLEQITDRCQGIVVIDGSHVSVSDEKRFVTEILDDLVYTAVFSSDRSIKDTVYWVIRRAAASLGIFHASIQSLYEAMGRGDVSGFSVPAINVRGLTYDTAQAVFRAMAKGNVGPVLFEIARSEMKYTEQPPLEYGGVITAAAIKTGYRGPLMLQGDHFQVNAKKYASAADEEIAAIKDLITEAIDAGIYNIDIDASTVVDLSRPTIQEQQAANYGITADLTAFIRACEPEDITVSTGGEIGEVGTKNTTVEEFTIFMDHYLSRLREHGGDLTGISKISIQTGTTHGGVPLADGSIAQANIDFDTLKKISRVARERYGLSGAVQHGASTLPNEAFDRFPAVGTAEIHLATGFQNILYDSEHFPQELRDRIYDYIRDTLGGERKESDTEEQFLYKTRKKAFGPFKHEMWHLPRDIRDAIGKELEQQFAFLFDKLGVVDTRTVVEKHIKSVDVPVEPPTTLR